MLHAVAEHAGHSCLQDGGRRPAGVPAGQAAHRIATLIEIFGYL